MTKIREALEAMCRRLTHIAANDYSAELAELWAKEAIQQRNEALAALDEPPKGTIRNLTNEEKEAFARSLLKSVKVDDGWIPVGERLPETTGYFLAWAAGRNCRPVVAWFHHLGRGWETKKEITHWRELPTPPKDKSDG